MTHDNKFMLAALGVSLLIHALIALPIWDLPIGQSHAALFNRPVTPEQTVPTYRTPEEDALVEDVQRASSPEPLAIEAAGERPEAVQSASQEMLERIDPTKLIADPGKPVEAVGEAGDQPRDDLPDTAGEPASPPTRLADATKPLIEHADADVDLPRFVEAEDAVATPAPSDARIVSPEHLNIASLIDALKSDDPVGPGNAGQAGNEDLAIGSGLPAPGSSAPGSMGTGRPGGNGNGNANAGANVKPLIPIDDLPPVAEALPEMEVDDKPVVRLDADFEYELRTYDGPVKLKQGLFDSPTLRAPGEPAWYEIVIRPRPSLQRLTPLAKDVVYVVDTSGSIESKWLGPVKAGVSTALDALNEGDRFNIVMFEQQVKLLNREGLVGATDANVKAARRFIDEAEVAGYTDVNKALAGLVKRKLPADRVYQIIFISDGTPTAGAISPQQIIDVFTRENAGVAAIYAVAVGDKVNQPLLDSLAYRNKGYVERPGNHIRATAVIRDLASRLRYPILKDATFNAAGVDARNIYPQQPRDIHQHDPISLFGRYDRNERVLMRVAGDSDAKRLAFTFTLKFTDAREGEHRIAAAWARAYVHHLTSRMLRRDAPDAARLKAEIEAITRRYGLD